MFNKNFTQILFFINILIDQLNEIRKVTLAGIFCANGDNIRQIQPFAMIAKLNL